MSEIDPRQLIDESQLYIAYIRSDGPGGQNVNKVATAVQLRFDVASSSLSEDIKAQLMKLAGKRLTQEGYSLSRPNDTGHKRPTKASQEKRLQSKKQRGITKRMRKRPTFEND